MMFKQGSKLQVKQPALVALTLIVSLVIVFLLNSERHSMISYALYLFAVLVHEIGHSVAAILTGGYVQGFVVNAGSGGYAMIAGGNPLITLPAGYVGCAVFGSAMLYLSNRYRWADLFAVLAGGFILVFTIAFGKPEENGAMTALHLAGGFGFVLMFCGLWGPLWLNMLMINIISTLTALQGLWGAWALYHLSEASHHNDAEMFSKAVMPWMTGNEVALIWAIISVILFALAVYFGVIKTMFHGGKRQWNYIAGKSIVKQ